MQNLEISFSQSLGRVLKKVGLLLYVLTLIESSADQWITMQMQELMMSPEGTGPMVYVYALSSLSLSLIFPSLILFFTVSALLPDSEKNSDHGRSFELLLIESLRSWGKVLRWSFLLIVPGILKWLELSFVPFVVLCSKKYQEGQVDALARSTEISKGHKWTLLGILIFMGIILPLCLTGFEDYKILWKTPLASLGYFALETLLSIVLGLWLFRLFVKWEGLRA